MSDSGNSKQVAGREKTRFVSQLDGVRLDRYLADVMSGSSRQLANRACEDGLVTVNGKVEKAGYVLRSGDLIEVRGRLEKAVARPEVGHASGVTLNVIFEDEQMLVVDKPRMMHSVTNDLRDPPTLADCLAAYSDACIDASPDAREAGLIHRLDFETTGAIIAAKSRSAFNKLRSQLMNSEVGKSYIALVEGTCDKEQIARFALEQIDDGKKMRALLPQKSGDVEIVETKISPLGLREEFKLNRTLSLVTAYAPRAKRHQVRVHLAALGMPLVGDTLYGSELSLGALQEQSALRDLPRDGFILHASTVAFEHPVDGRRIEIEAKNDTIELCRKNFVGKKHL